MRTIEQLLEDCTALVENLRSRPELNINMDAKAALVRSADILPRGRVIVGALRTSLESLEAELEKLEAKANEKPEAGC